VSCLVPELLAAPDVVSVSGTGFAPSSPPGPGTAPLREQALTATGSTGRTPWPPLSPETATRRWLVLSPEPAGAPEAAAAAPAEAPAAAEALLTGSSAGPASRPPKIGRAHV